MICGSIAECRGLFCTVKCQCYFLESMSVLFDSFSGCCFEVFEWKWRWVLDIKPFAM